MDHGGRDRNARQAQSRTAADDESGAAVNTQLTKNERHVAIIILLFLF